MRAVRKSMNQSLEFGSLGPGRGAPFVVPLALGILAVTALMLLMVDPPDAGDWVMVGLVAAVCLPIAAFALTGRHVLVDAGAGRVVLTYSVGPLRWRRRRALAEFQAVTTRFRPVSARAWLVRATPVAQGQVRETFQVVLEGRAPFSVHSYGLWRNPDDNRLEAEAAARAIAAATGLAARREGYRLTERAGPAGVTREIRQEAGAATPLD
jgi:hypothetical protein